MLRYQESPDTTPQPTNLFRCCFPVVTKNPGQILQPLPVPPIHSASPFTKSLHDLTQRARRAFSNHGFHNTDNFPLVRSESSHLLTNDTSSYFTPDFNVRSIQNDAYLNRNATGDFSDSSAGRTPLPPRRSIKPRTVINDTPYEESTDTSERPYSSRLPVRPWQSHPYETPSVRFHRRDGAYPPHIARDRETGMQEEVPKEMAWTAHTPPKEYLRSGDSTALWNQMSRLSHERLTASLARVQDYYDSQKYNQKDEKPVRNGHHSAAMPQSGGTKSIKNKRPNKCAVSWFCPQLYLRDLLTFSSLILPRLLPGKFPLQLYRIHLDISSYKARELPEDRSSGENTRGFDMATSIMHLKEIQAYQRNVARLPSIQYVQDPGQKVQLKTLFQYIIDRDLPNVHKFHSQGFPGIFQAHEYKTGNTAMHVAAYKNDPELMEWLLNQGADIDARNRAGVSPLMVAVHHGYFDMVQLLARNGADLSAEDRFGQNLLWYCFGGTERHTQIASFCLNTEKPTEPSSNLVGKPILVRACEKGDKARDIVELLIRDGCDVNEVAVRTGRTPMIEAARRGATGVMQLLLQEGADPDLVDHKQVHSTHEAAYHGQVGALQVLASAGARLDSPAHNGNTPLHLAVAAQQLPAVRFLAHRGANPSNKNKLGMTVKQLAKKYGLKAASKEMNKAEKQHKKVENKFIIGFYDWFQENTDALKTALCNVNSETENEEKPPMENTDMNKPDSVTKEQLTTVMQSLNAPVKEEELPLLVEALDSKKTGTLIIPDIFKAAEKLLPKAFLKTAYSAEKGKGKKGKGKKKKKKKKKRPKLKLPKGLKISICVAEEEDSPMAFKNSLHVPKHVTFGDKVVSGLTKKESSTPFTSDNVWTMEQSAVESSPVGDLCRDGDWQSVVRACKKGLDVNQCDKLYKTPLMYAAASGRWDMVQMLLAYGANPNIVDNFGWSALHHACRRGEPMVIDELVQAGSDINLHTLAGATPLMKAIESNSLDSVLYCILHGANLQAKTVCGVSIKDYAATFGNYRIYRAIYRFLHSYKGGRNLREHLAAVDPNQKFPFANQDLLNEYGKDVRGIFRRKAFLQKKTLLKSVLRAKEPVRAVKPKAAKIAAANAVGAPPPAADTPDADMGEKPPTRIPVTPAGMPLPYLITPNIPEDPSKKKQAEPSHEKAGGGGSGGGGRTPTPALKVTTPRTGSFYRSPSNINIAEGGDSDVTPPEGTNDPDKNAKREAARKFFAEASKKFEMLTTAGKHKTERSPLSDPFWHDVDKFGRTAATQVMHGRTEMERTARMLRNHVDLWREGDTTFYAPPPEEWSPPTREEMVRRLQLQVGLFDRMIQPSVAEDPVQKYVRKAEKQMKDEQRAKKFTEKDGGEEQVGKGLPRRFSVTEELMRLEKMHPTDARVEYPEGGSGVLPSLSFMEMFLGEVKKANAQAVNKI